MAKTTIKREFITQGKAFHLLNNNYNKQRKVNNVWVKTLASDMENGNWDDSAVNPIKITSDGKLIDGQHRLMAVLESGKNNYFWVARGCSEEEFLHTDEAQPRRVNQFVDGKFANERCAIARTAISIKRGKSFKNVLSGGVNGISRHDIIEEIANNEDYYLKVVQLASRMKYSTRVAGVSPYSAFIHVVNEVGDPSQIESFVDDFSKIVPENRTCSVAKNSIQSKALRENVRQFDRVWLVGLLLSAYESYLKAKDVNRINNQTQMIDKYAGLLKAKYGEEE